MIEINGMEIEFDIVNRKDYKQFVKNFEKFKKILGNKTIDLDPLEIIISDILGKEQTEKLLEDGRMDTLMIVSVELFENMYEQYIEFHTNIESMKERMEILNKKINKEV